MSVYEQNARWYYNFMLYGIRKHGACRGCRTRSEALEFEAEIKNDVSLIHRNKKDLSEIITVKQMFNEYLEYSKINNKPDVYRDNKHKVDVMEEFFGADTTINKITPALIEKLKAYIIDKLKLTKATFNRYFASLKKAFNLLIINHKLNMLNPCKLVSAFTEDNQIIRYLTEDEEKRLMKELPKYLKPIIICALTTGLRKSNILNLKWESIDFEYNLFGFVFFAAGVSIGCFLKGFGIIFLFSHGVTGMCIMEASLLGDLLNSPILTDAPKWFPVSAGIVIFMFIVAILSLIVHNLSDTVKKMKYFKLIPLVCFFIAFLLTIIIRRILL